MGLKQWAYEELCEGRIMKAPSPTFDLTEIKRQEPTCYLGWAPLKVDKMGNLQEIPLSTVPGILIMPNQSYGQYIEGKRFDRYDNVQRSSSMGQEVAITMLFSVYEPGMRLPGFVDSAGDMGQGIDTTLIVEGTEQGLLTLTSWMDDCLQKLLGQKEIRHTDMALQESSLTYSLYTEGGYVSDKRPIYYGYINMSFYTYANEEYNPDIQDLLF